MALKDDLESRVKEFAQSIWPEIPEGRVVPTPESLNFGNTGIYINACVLYADIHRSTAMVAELSATRAAEYYKAFLHCAAKLIRYNNGTIVAYDGDRIMAIYMGDNRANQSIKTALELYWVVENVINKQFNETYKTTSFNLKHTVGIDAGKILASKTGVRVDSDIVWVGDAANHASKLNSFPNLDITYRTRITPEVWNLASVNWCFNGVSSMWLPEEEVDGIKYRRSSYWSSL